MLAFDDAIEIEGTCRVLNLRTNRNRLHGPGSGGDLRSRHVPQHWTERVGDVYVTRRRDHQIVEEAAGTRCELRHLLLCGDVEHGDGARHSAGDIQLSVEHLHSDG